MRISAGNNEEAVSEAIGFIIIFGLVLTGITLITLYGYPMLMQQQSNADVRNMEQTMVVLQNDIKSLCYKNVPYKETSMQVSGGSLAVVNTSGTTQTFTITGLTTRTFNPGMLLYDSDNQDAAIALENGAVIRAQAGGSSMLAEPRWYVDTDFSGKKTLVINLIALNSTGAMARSGMGGVRLKLDKTEPLMDETTPGDVTVTYAPSASRDFSKAWENYLTGSLGMTKSGNTYTLSGVDRLIVKKYDILVLSL